MPLCRVSCVDAVTAILADLGLHKHADMEDIMHAVAQQQFHAFVSLQVPRPALIRTPSLH